MKDSAKSGSTAFRPRARLMKIIGAELISDEVVALVELVKNAYDADASQVNIAFRGVTQPGGSIIVSDDGHGMSRDVLLHRWMEPASAWKQRNGGRTKTGRRLLGEKGVGRFAADKLAAKVEVLSRCPRATEEVRATVDWDRFEDDDRLLSDVRCQWRLQRGSRKRWHGTVLTLSNLRETWNERMFRRLSTRLARLVAPNAAVSDFKIAIESDEFPDYSGEVRTTFLERAPHRIEARFDGVDEIEVRVGEARPEKFAWNGSGELRCGPVEVRIFAFDLDQVGRVGPALEVRAWLKQWTGISVYRDGFRVWPYGEPHDDWLRLDQRRVNNPVVRLSNNQLVGFVHLSQDGNPDLRDQTNREGMIQNRALDDLRRLLSFVLQILEAERQAIRHPAGKSEEAQKLASNGDRQPWLELEALAKSTEGSLKLAIDKACRKLKETQASESVRQERLIDDYTRLAAAAQLSGSLRAAVRTPLEGVRTACESLSQRLNGSGTRSLRSELKALRKNVAEIDARMDMFALVEGDGSAKRRRTIDVVSELDRFKSIVLPLLDENSVGLKATVESGQVLRVEMRPGAFHRLLYILTANSMDWLGSAEQRQIRIRATSRQDSCEFVFSDTGPGIPPSLHERVFEPFYSTKEHGQGLGLAVARSLVMAHRGQIEILGRRRSGAHVRFVLPRRRSRATLGHN